MVPDPTRKQISFPQLDYPIYRDEPPKSVKQWIEGKQIQDGAEGLWRVHDNLYDLTNFVTRHPGGTQWITLTKGTDITEAFETHHIRSNAAELILEKYFIRKAITPRNSPFTFESDGFYKTFKAKVKEELPKIPKNVSRTSDMITDALLISFFTGLTICCWFFTNDYVLCGIASIFILGYMLSALVTCAHNYFHKADNWRMYLYNLSGFSYIDWRISHAMSHHLYTNTANDIELSMLEPVLQFLPNPNKSFAAQCAALYAPIFYCLTNSLVILQEITDIIKLDINDWSKFIPFSVPVWMWLTSGLNLLSIIAVWFAVIVVYSFIFSLFGLTAGHHSERNFFEGDTPKAEIMDWGIHQLYTIVERMDLNKSYFRVLTSFGDHYLHHLFPTLDHAELSYLYPTLYKHCEKFETQLRTTTFYSAMLQNLKQLTRTKLNNFKLENSYK